MEEWINEIRNLDFPEYRKVLQERIDEANRASNECIVDYYRTLILAIAMNTLNRMPRNVYQSLKDEYGDREPEMLDDDADPVLDLMYDQLLNYVDVYRTAVKGKVTIKFKRGKIKIIVNIPKRLVHDEYVKFFEDFVCGDEIEWGRCREEEGVINDHEVFLTKKELRKYRRIC